MLQEIESLSEKKELKSEEVQRYIPLFYYPLGMALLILLIATSSMTKRERVSVPSVFILFALLFTTPHAEAALLDFVELHEAKSAYEKGEYEKASKLYEKHAEISKSGQSYYNAGNALYKQNKYEEAIKSYEKATFSDEKQRAKNFANLGNSYAKEAKEESLPKAVKAYEESLKLNEDKEVRENLEEVKKLIEKQKQEQKEKEDKKEEKSQDKKDDKNSKGDEKDDKNQKSDEKDDKNQDSKDSKEQKSDDKKDSKEKESQDKKDLDKEQDKSKSEAENSEKKSDEMKSQKEDEQKQHAENNQTKEQEQKKQDLKELDKNENNATNGASSAENLSKNKMSEAEEAKWIEQLNSQQNTYMYRLDKQKPQEENPNEKPW
jgi:Ca-activated chloride channel family protein